MACDVEASASRSKLFQLLDDAHGADDLARRLGKCGQKIRLRCFSCGDPRDCETRCDLKWCPVCQRARAAMTTDRFKRVMAEVNVRWPLFVTFTCAHDSDDGWELIRQVRRAHTRFRRHRWFKACVSGGVCAFECQNSAGGLHPHVHCLFDCRWFAVSVKEPKFTNAESFKRAARRACEEVGELWSDALGRKGSVKVRRVWKRDGGDIGAALAEVIKYSVQGAALAELDAGDAVELIRVLDRTRNVVGFGSFFGHTAIKQERRGGMCACGCSDWQFDPPTLAEKLRATWTDRTR